MASPATKVPKNAPVLSRDEALDTLRQVLFEDAEFFGQRYHLVEADLVEVLDDLVEWFGGRPVATPRRKAVRR